MDATTQQRKVTLGCPHCGRLNRVNLARASEGPKCGECGKAIQLDRPVQLADATFARVITDAQVPVLVDFYADWCGPCKMMAPMLDEMARARMGSVLIAKLDTDRNQHTAARFGISSIPTLIVFKDGREVDRQVGALPRPRLEAILDAAIR
ncbi:MAG TPA: thioredoxin TrxC [Longimicrobium sp.]|nr:thioredoxin TrxC [Longimicrobium sp.]